MCYDIFKGNEGSFLENSGFTTKEYSKTKACYFGGIGSVIPFFYLLRKLYPIEKILKKKMHAHFVLLRILQLRETTRASEWFAAARGYFDKKAQREPVGGSPPELF